MADDTAFDWTEYDRLSRELESLNLGYSSYHRSCQNLEWDGWDEHGVVPGEGAMYERLFAELRQKFEALGDPPACTTCRGQDYYHTSGPDSCGDYWTDEHPSTCPACGRRPEWDPYTGEKIDWDSVDDRAEFFAQRQVCLPVYDHDVPF